MIGLGLSALEQRDFQASLTTPHRIAVRVEILNQNEGRLGSIATVGDRGPSVVSGAVQVDTTADVSRQLTLELLDPAGEISIVPNAPSEAAIFADNFVRVWRLHWVPALERWVEVPVFTGPITRLASAPPIVQIEALGKEVLARDPALAWRPYAIGEGTKILDAIERLLRGQGERDFVFPKTPTQKLRRKLSVPSKGEPWKIAKRLAGDLNMQLFYDGAGAARLRRAPTQRCYEFATGDGGAVLTRPDVSYDISSVRNIVEVIGPDPDGPKKPSRIVARPPGGHPLSAETLSRNGEPRYLVQREEMSDVKRRDKLRNKANAMLADNLRAELDVQLEVLPIPHLDELDVVAVMHEGRPLQFPLRQFTIPLTAESMSVNWLKRLKLKRKRKRGN